jgi:AmiR/NasT family two-component response regulator
MTKTHATIVSPMSEIRQIPGLALSWHRFGAKINLKGELASSLFSFQSKAQTRMAVFT